MPHYFVINLNRSVERWKSFTRSPVYSPTLFTRVTAVDGATAAEAEYIDFDIQRFRLCNGRHPRPTEYGCYVSHIKAIRAFLASDHETAVILEDDTVIAQEQLDFCDFLERQYADHKIMVRLEANRYFSFEALHKTPFHHHIGQCWFGPSGGACAYWISRDAAKALVDKIAIGYLPIDVMLERAWYHGVHTYLVHPRVVPHPTPPFSEIKRIGGPRYRKFAKILRLPTLVFRTKELVKRLYYSAMTRHVI